VCANGRRNTGSRGPGACPITNTSLTTAPPETGVDFIRGQRRHLSNRATWLWSKARRRDVLAMRANLRGSRRYLRKIEKIENSRLKTMLIMMQVTIGK
jgi:hypothetical protein